MTKTAAILAGTAILVGGCQISPPSPTWRSMIHAPHPERDAGEPDRVFAADLHRILLDRHVPHKIVTAQFTYRRFPFGDATAERTVVVYRDAAKKREGWWLMEERLNVPFWLPDEPLDRQISFYLARASTIVNVSDFTEPDHAKLILAADQTPPRRTGTTTIQRVDHAPAKATKSDGAKSNAKKKPEAKAPKPAPVSKIEPAPAPPKAPSAKVSGQPATKTEHQAETKVVPTPKAKTETKAVEKGPAKPDAKAPAKPAEKKDEKPKEKSKPESTPAVRPSMGTPGKPRENLKESQPKEAPASDAPPKSKSDDDSKKPKGAPDSTKETATKPDDKPAVKPGTKAVPTGKPAEQPDLFDNSGAAKAGETKSAKATDKKSVKPAVKAASSGKPVEHPDLFNRSDATPQATIIDETPAKPKKDENADKKKDEPSNKPKPEADAQKPNFFKRIFRRIFTRPRPQD